MSFIKKQMAQGDKVIDYTNDLEDRVEVGFDDVDDITTSLSSDVNALNNFKDDVADYVVEQGTNYTKWNSGKLEQWGLGSITTSNNTITFPMSFYDNNYIPFVQLGSVQAYDRSVGVERVSSSSMKVHVFNAPASVGAYWKAIGRWK